MWQCCDVDDNNMWTAELVTMEEICQKANTDGFHKLTAIMESESTDRSS